MKIKFTINILLFFFYYNIAFGQTNQIVINEFLSSNSSVIKDPDYKTYSDWIEFYNPQDIIVDLSRWYLTDKLNDTTKWQIPDGTIVLPGEYLVIWADRKDTLLQNIHTNFQLSKNSEAIGLFDNNKILIDSITYDNHITNISYGRKPDGDTDWYFFDTPTPWEPNTTDLFNKANNPSFTINAGFYTSEQSLEILSDDSDATIRYTINGDEPTDTSQIYSTPLLLKSRKGDVNVLSNIRTNKDPFSWLPNWESPSEEVFKATVIRARVFKEGINPSDVITNTYFIDEYINQKYSTLPVISLVSDYKHLFDNNSGIYVPGIHHTPGNSSSGNYFKDWEKPAHIEYFTEDKTLGFSQDAGIKVQGGTSPASPQKGLHVIARNEYGNNRFNFPIFSKDPSNAGSLKVFKRFIIRSWGSLISGAMLSDAYAHRLMAKKDLDIQAYQPVVVFINGEYWGLHSLRESNKNSWYYQSHYGIDRDDPGYDILNHSSKNGLPFPNAEEGDSRNWNLLMSFINSNDMSNEYNYELLKNKIDMPNFINYIGHCMYLGKWDWPNNNEASWRPRNIKGKWRWVQYDTETGFGAATVLGPQYKNFGAQFNMVKVVTEGVFIPGFRKYGPHPIVKQLISNNEFKDSLYSWFVYHLEHEFHPDSMNTLLDEMVNQISPYMDEYKKRSPYIGSMNNGWEKSINKIKEFIDLRPEYMLAHLSEITKVEYNKTFNYTLEQNYPNPFNIETIIQYSIPKAGNVKLSIYNILGEVIEIYNVDHNEAGTYSFKWNANNIASGVYLYSIRSGKYKEIRKMILLK